MRMVRFYSFALSPYALKVRCYLLFLGIDFETVFVDPIQIRKTLPVGTTIPVLTIDDVSRNESSEIGVWLNDTYPENELIPEALTDEIFKADKWVDEKLIALVFRDVVGFDDSLPSAAKKRLHLSKMLDQTTPNGVSGIFRLLHLLFLGFTFVQRHVNTTDKSRPIDQLQSELSAEFETLLNGGPFLCGSKSPTMADLSAYPQVVNPKVIRGRDYFLPGKAVEDWVVAMERAVPNLTRCFPEIIKFEKAPH